MRFRDLQWSWKRERFGQYRVSKNPSRIQAKREGNRSQYLNEGGRCIGFAVQFTNDEWGFMLFGELGNDDFKTGLTKLELAAIIAPMVPHADPDNPLIFERAEP
ncbi:hypothetical protein [Methylobacterium sp. 285MFTsu5.1]|uniref:hypothetical protein n=1 Tax=Methylobacterium sp. 285MFTsu5.1 TaxID=1172187 RepID=UPI0003683DC7|nr:hypothetical protein [Methylobacterium sp. 285MFTsu5.1]